MLTKHWLNWRIQTLRKESKTVESRKKKEKKVARTSNFTIGNLDLMNNDEALVPDIMYHRKCYQIFTMKSKL